MLDYANQYATLVPILANAYCLKFMANKLMEMHDEFIKTNAKFDVAARTSDSDFLEMMLEKCKDTGYAKILRDEIGKTSPNLLNAAKEIKSLQDPILNARGKKKGNYKNNGDKEVQLANSSKNKSNKPNDKTKKGNGKKNKKEVEEEENSDDEKPKPKPKSKGKKDKKVLIKFFRKGCSQFLVRGE